MPNETKVVPVEPTQKILDAMGYWEPLSDKKLTGMYKAALEATPSQQQSAVAWMRLYTVDGEADIVGLHDNLEEAQEAMDTMNADFPHEVDRRSIVPLYTHAPKALDRAEFERVWPVPEAFIFNSAYNKYSLIQGWRYHGCGDDLAIYNAKYEGWQSATGVRDENKRCGI